MSELVVGFQVGQRVTVMEGPFMTLEAVVMEAEENSTTAKGGIVIFGKTVGVTLTIGAESRVIAEFDRSEEIARHAGATHYYGIVGRVVAGADAGRCIRVDRMQDFAETPEERALAKGDMIRIADDPAMEIACRCEWVEDWAAVEETLLRDGHRVDWQM
ncbi:hypothetical protein [Nocardia sp. NPDC057668]|uniref:hypothetical protein n=1 Tax=Nocardia sp. NPDC057668 TaxID=3346202 RepID=UPI00366AB459